MMMYGKHCPDGGGEKKQDEKKADFYLSIQHNDYKLNRIPLTAEVYEKFLKQYGDSYLKYIRLESSNFEHYIIPNEILMNGIIKIEKS